MTKILNLRLGITSEFLNTKIFLLKDTHQTGEEIFVASQIKNTAPSTYVINDLNGEEIIGKRTYEFMKKNYRRLIKKNLECD